MELAISGVGEEYDIIEIIISIHQPHPIQFAFT
jgi:hypothetical protein